MLRAMVDVRALPGPRRAVAGAVIALLALAGPAEAGWGEPRTVSPRDMLVQQSALAVGGERVGVLMAGIRRTHGVRRWTLLAKLGDRPLQRLGGSVFAPQIAVGADGTAVAAWAAGGSLRVAVARPGHGFGAPQTVATAAGVLPGGIAVAADGSATVAWRNGDGGSAEARVALRAPGGRFGAPRTLGPTAYPPELALSPDGQTVVTWLSRPPFPQPGQPPAPESNPRVLAALLGSNRAPSVLAGPPDFLGRPPDATGGPGGVVVGWQDQAVRRIVRLGRTGAWEPLAPLSTAPGAPDELGDQVALALPADGELVAAWSVVRTRSPENPTVVSSRVRASVEPFAASQTLSNSAWRAGAPNAAAVGRRAIVAWSEHDGTRARVRTRVRGGAGWGRTRVLAKHDAVGAVHLAGGGDSAALAWVGRSGRGPGRLRVATYRP